MTDTSPDPASPARRELDSLRSLLRGVIDLIHRGLHELDPHEPEVAADPDAPSAPSGDTPPAADPDAPSGDAPPATDPDAPAVDPGAPSAPSGDAPAADPDTPAPDPDAPSPTPAPGTGAPSTGDDGDVPTSGSGSEPTAPNCPDDSDPNEPATPLPTPPTTEPTMPIGTRNFAFAHARITSDGEEVRVTKATGFTPAITHPTDPDPAYCAPADDLPRVARVRPADADDLPPNTLLYRLTLPANHQIDKDEAVVIASGADRLTHSAYDMTAWPVNDRSIEVALELRHPDVNNESEDIFTVDVLVLRVD